MSEDEFEYDDYDENEGGFEVENLFYSAEDHRSNQPSKAKEEFQKVVDLEISSPGGLTSWGVKALTQLVLLNGREGNEREATTKFEQLLHSTDRVTRNEASEAVSTVLDSLQVDAIYELALNSLKTGNPRLWYSAAMKYTKLLLDTKDSARLQAIVPQLHAYCNLSDGRVDPQKLSQFLEISAIELQATKDRRKIREIHRKTLALSSVVSDPRTVAAIRETGGLLFLNHKDKYDEAYNEFFESFKNYQEAGHSLKAKNVLKLAVLANILALSDINPFDSREAKAFLSDPEIQVILQLRVAWEQQDLKALERLVEDPSLSLMTEDQVVKARLLELLVTAREQSLLSIVAAYETISLEVLAARLRISLDQLLPVILRLTRDAKLHACIDATGGFLEISRPIGDSALILCGKWAEALLVTAKAF